MRDCEEGVETLRQRIFEDDGHRERQHLSVVSIFGYWRKTVTQVLQVRTALRTRWDFVEGQGNELAKRREELDHRDIDSSKNITP